MRLIASIAMFLAWLLFGAMPAIGMPSLPNTAVQHEAGVAEHHGAHAQHVAKDVSHRPHHKPQQPCSHGGKLCSAPFCASCLTTAPLLAQTVDDASIHEAPVPVSDAAVASPGPTPPTPPPRA